MNPLSQLFALRVEDIPGYQPSSGTMSPEQKESITSDLIFGDALKACDRSAVRAFGQKMFGTVSVSETVKRSPRLATVAATTAAKPPPKQITLTGFLVPQEPQSFASTKALLEEIAREKEKKKKSVSPPPKEEKAKRAKKTTGVKVDA